MKSHKRKMIAPILISIIILLYYALYFTILVTALNDTVLSIALGIIPILLSFVMLKVCIERINEIKRGEEDDLSKY